LKIDDYVDKDGYFTRAIKRESNSFLGFIILILVVLIAIAIKSRLFSSVFIIVSSTVLIITTKITTRLKLNKTKLILEYSIWNYSLLAKYYNIDRIINLKYRQNVKSDTYTSKGHIKFLGQDLTPEEWKTYYYHKEILQFDYKDKYINIGKYSERFDGKIFYELITAMQNT
jgi:hypothetical protein